MLLACYNNVHKFVSHSSPTVEHIEELFTTQDINTKPSAKKNKEKRKLSSSRNDTCCCCNISPKVPKCL